MSAKKILSLITAVCICLAMVSCTKVTGISLSSTTLRMKPGETATLTVHVDSSKSIGNPPEFNFKWSSSDDNVALVNSEGDVTANHAGSCNIICTADDFEASCTVTVEEDETAADSGNSGNQDNSGGGTTIINNYYNDYNDDYGAHFAPDYEFNEGDFVFPESSVRKLSKSEIRSTLNSMPGLPITDSFAQDAINEIYARNGYVFTQDGGAKAYYESKSWYYPDYSFTTGDFSSIEKYNINLLSEFR